jgi:hypothetical protein
MITKVRLSLVAVIMSGIDLDRTQSISCCITGASDDHDYDNTPRDGAFGKEIMTWMNQMQMRKKAWRYLGRDENLWLHFHLHFVKED